MKTVNDPYRANVVITAGVPASAITAATRVGHTYWIARACAQAFRDAKRELGEGERELGRIAAESLGFRVRDTLMTPKGKFLIVAVAYPINHRDDGAIEFGSVLVVSGRYYKNGAPARKETTIRIETRTPLPYRVVRFDREYASPKSKLNNALG